MNSCSDIVNSRQNTLKSMVIHLSLGDLLPPARIPHKPPAFPGTVEHKEQTKQGKEDQDENK